MQKIKLAVIGTLMRGLDLNGNLIEAGAEFLRETKTARAYRMWSIDGKYPAMQKVTAGWGITHRGSMGTNQRRFDRRAEKRTTGPVYRAHPVERR